MEVCTNSPQAYGQVNGAASPYVDPDFEFNAPRFYDFQRLNDNVSSPSSEGDTYFDTSKVKELRTPIRDDEGEENEDTMQLAKDIQKVREALQTEGEATSQRRRSSDDAPLPASSPAHAGCAGEETAGKVPDVAQSARLPTAVDSQPAPESAPIAAAASAPLRVRVASAAAVEAEHPSAAQGSKIARQRLTSLDISQGANTGAALAAAAAAAEAEVCEQKPLQRMNTGAAINRPAAQGQPETEMGPRATDWAQGSARGAAQGVPAAEDVSQSAGGPAPWPMHPVKLQGACTAGMHAGVGQPAAEKAAFPKSAAPANVVTSWESTAVRPMGSRNDTAQQPAPALTASGKALLAHIAGKAKKDVVRATVSKENAGRAVGAPSGAAGMAGKKSGSARVGLAGGRAAAGEQGASTNSGKPAKRAAELSGGVPAGGTAQEPAKKRLRAGAPGLSTKGPVQASRPQAAQKSLTVPRSPRLGRARSNVPQDNKQFARTAAQATAAQKLTNRAPANKRALTNAKTPQLRTSKRRRCADDVATATAPEQEEWKPLALMVAEFEASTPARFNHGPRAVQYIPPPQPDPNARAAAPDLATDGRLRPSRFKPREEQELEEMSQRPAFHALPLNAAVMSSRGDLGVRPVPARPLTRSQTPKLATKARAAAHPAPPPQYALAKPKKATINPGTLTVPQSPAFATRSRMRAQGLAPAEGAEAFEFKARPVPDLGVGQPAARAQKSQRRQTSSSIKPFQLSTEVRGRTQRSASAEAEPVEAPAFHAAPVPKSLYQPAKLPAITEAKPTQQEAFRLLSEDRHQQAVAELAARRHAEQQRARRASSFRAAPPPQHLPPPPPARSERPTTRAITPHLAVETRSAKRAAFDAAVAKSKKEEEEKRAAQAAERAAEEARELKHYRSQLTFKARPMPEHSTGPQRMSMLPEPKMTIPSSPQLQTRFRARLPR